MKMLFNSLRPVFSVANTFREMVFGALEKARTTSERKWGRLHWLHAFRLNIFSSVIPLLGRSDAVPSFSYSLDCHQVILEKPARVRLGG